MTVVYLSLGGRRTRAARAYTADLAAAGAEVLLVVADRPEWKDVAVAPGVTLHRLGSERTGASIRAARKFLLGGDRLAGADLLIAGDPEATPVVEAVRRKFPRLQIRLEPAAEPDRRTAEADLAVVTPWYPSPDDPFAGAFVKATTGTVLDGMGRVATLHTENWVYSEQGITGKEMTVGLTRLFERGQGVVVEDTPEGEVTRAAYPQVISGGTYAIWAKAQIARLEQVLPTGRIEAPLIHAHTGHYAGVVATELARPDARIVVTEHATFLPKVFAQPGSRKLYGDMLDRVDRLLCVGQYLHDLVVERFPQHRDKVRIVPNPIDFDQFVVRPEPPKEPLRWLYVGRMLEHKGVATLVDAFAEVAAEEPRATLTLVGAGAMVGPLAKRIAALGLPGRVDQRPAVPPDQVAGLMHDHDVLVHASHLETFGMTIVEAVATGTPVLVARSQGPAETLAGLEGVAGITFDVTEDPAVIVAAWRRLRDQWSGLDLADAREKLRARYGREAVGAQLREVFREVMAEEPASSRADRGPALKVPLPAPDADRIAVVAISPPGSGRTRRFINTARERGFGVDLIALDPERWTQHKFDAGVRIIGIGATEDRRPVRLLERTATVTFPRWALGFAKARAERLPGTLPEAMAITGQRGHRRVAGAFNRRIYDRWYNVVRPRVLWRIVERDVLPQLDAARIKRVVVHGPPGVVIGWRLAQLWPGVPVSTALTMPEEFTSS